MAKTALKAQPRPLERGQRLTLRLGQMDQLGDCIADCNGFPVHVFGGIPGELVSVEVDRCFFERAVAHSVQVLEPSPHRVSPPCPYFWPCTGCQWQHIRYDEQLAIKRRVVESALSAHGLEHMPVWPALPSPQPTGYRNHARFTVGPAGSVGFVNRSNRQFVKIEECLIMHEGINKTLGVLQGHSAETTQLSVRYGANTADQLLQPRFRDPAITVPSGQIAYVEKMLGRRFRVASPSFFQVNTPQATRMVQLVRAHLTEKPKLLIDAYAGVGTFSVLLEPFVERVIAIEESASSVKDARENAAGLANVEFLLGKTEALLPQMTERPDVLILDPPRTGCFPEALAAAVKLQPETVFYISCDPATLGRDLAILTGGGYQVSAVYPVDMFPHTHHIEAVVVLKRGSATLPRRRLVLASASPRRRELLAALGVPFDVAPSSLDESAFDRQPDSALYVEQLAFAKAQAVAGTLQDAQALVIGADTTVVVDGRRLGKPASADEARAMLRHLRGRTHEVFTGIAILDAASGQAQVRHHRSVVHMRHYTDAEIDAYIATGDPLDKAGAYAIQHTGFHPVEHVEGCYFNVVGLPVCVLGAALAEFNLDTPFTHVWGKTGDCHVCHIWAPIQEAKQ